MTDIINEIREVRQRIFDARNTVLTYEAYEDIYLTGKDLARRASSDFVLRKVMPEIYKLEHKVRKQ